MLANGVEISTDKGFYNTLPCTVSVISNPENTPQRKLRDEKHGVTSWVAITLCEGKFRQIRKMTAKVGYPTLRLVRVRIANCSLELHNSNMIIPLST